MGRLTKEQVDFAKGMTIKQRRVLQSLAKFPFYMSATEHSDPELHDLIRHRLVSCTRCMIVDSDFDGGHPSWGATHAGRIIAVKLQSGSL